LNLFIRRLPQLALFLLGRLSNSFQCGEGCSPVL